MNFFPNSCFFFNLIIFHLISYTSIWFFIQEKITFLRNHASYKFIWTQLAVIITWHRSLYLRRSFAISRTFRHFFINFSFHQLAFLRCNLGTIFVWFGFIFVKYFCSAISFLKEICRIILLSLEYISFCMSP